MLCYLHHEIEIRPDRTLRTHTWISSARLIAAHRRPFRPVVARKVSSLLQYDASGWFFSSSNVLSNASGLFFKRRKSEMPV